MKRTFVQHHSVSDWDFQDSLIYSLTPIYYISPPTSLKLERRGGYPAEGAVLCRIATTQNLPQGRVITAGRKAYDANNFKVTFRNQAPLGSSAMNNCYMATLEKTRWLLHSYIDGTPTIIGTQAATSDPGTWEFLRITWWNGMTPAGEEALAVTMEKYIAGEWVKQGDTIYHEANLWKDSEINRCGLSCYVIGADYYVWYDDTEIWGPEE